jgi:hypothetical protein
LALIAPIGVETSCPIPTWVVATLINVSLTIAVGESKRTRAIVIPEVKCWSAGCTIFTTVTLTRVEFCFTGFTSEGSLAGTLEAIDKVYACTTIATRVVAAIIDVFLAIFS